MQTTHSADVLIVGAGIVGLAQALACARQGLKVAVVDRTPQAVGASIRNFGMVWPVGQPNGPLLARALRSRQIWLEVSQGAGFAAEEVGSLHVARREDELAVLEEFVARRDAETVVLLAADEAAAKSPGVVRDGLLGALWSRTEVIVDPREAIAKLPAYLRDRYGVQFSFGTVIAEVGTGRARSTAGKTWQADRIFICSGADFETLYPQLYRDSGITRVKLQMMRTVPQPNGWRIGPALCAGLTLTHYAAFAECPSLPTLKARIAAETPHFPQWHIHVMASQNARGELILGDHHEYGWNLDPFDRADINTYVLDYLRQFATAPSFEIAATWHGVYAKLPGRTEWVARPEPGVTVVNGLGGAGMTLSFGLAEELAARELGIAATV